jgi:hypothetical protein
VFGISAFWKIKFTNFVNMITVKFPPYLRCSIVILDSSGAFPFLKVEMHSLSSSSIKLLIIQWQYWMLGQIILKT